MIALYIPPARIAGTKLAHRLRNVQADVEIVVDQARGKQANIIVQKLSKQHLNMVDECVSNLIGKEDAATLDEFLPQAKVHSGQHAEQDRFGEGKDEDQDGLSFC